MLSENMPSAITKAAVVGLIGILFWSALLNVCMGIVPSPWGFPIVLIGFSLFFMAKMSLFSRGKLLSFGTKNMSHGAANAYRFGYWLMAVGFLCTFWGPSI